MINLTLLDHIQRESGSLKESTVAPLTSALPTGVIFSSEICFIYLFLGLVLIFY